MILREETVEKVHLNYNLVNMAFKDPSPALSGPPSMTIFGARFEVPQVDSPNFNLPQTVNTLDVRAAAAAASAATSQGANTNAELTSTANAPSPSGGLGKIGELSLAIAGLAAVGAAGAALATGKTGLGGEVAPGLSVGVGLTGTPTPQPTLSALGGIGKVINTPIGPAVSGVGVSVNTTPSLPSVGGVGGNAGVSLGGGVNAGINLGPLGGAGVGINTDGVSVGANLGSKCGVGAALASGAIPSIGLPGIGINGGLNANIKLPDFGLGALGGLNLGNLGVGARLRFKAPCIVVDGLGNLWFPDKFPMSELFGNFVIPALGTILSGQQINIGINAGINLPFQLNTDLYNFANKFGANIAGSVRGIVNLAGSLGVSVDLDCLAGLLGCERINVAASKLKKVRIGMPNPKVPLPIVGARTKSVKVTKTINSKPLNDLLNLPKS